MDQPLPAHSSKTDRSLSHPTIQSDLDSQTAPPQARNNASGYSAALSHGQRTGFAGGMAGMRYPLLCLPLLDDPSQCSCRTKPDYLHHRSSLSGCRLVAVKVVDLLAAFLISAWMSWFSRSYL